MSFLPKAAPTNCAPITEQLNNATTRAQTNQRIVVVVAFLQANINLDLTPEAIAREVSLSSSRLNSLFKESTGLPLGQYMKLLELLR